MRAFRNTNLVCDQIYKLLGFKTERSSFCFQNCFQVLKKRQQPPVHVSKAFKKQHGNVFTSLMNLFSHGAASGIYMNETWWVPHYVQSLPFPKERRDSTTNCSLPQMLPRHDRIPVQLATFCFTIQTALSTERQPVEYFLISRSFKPKAIQKRPSLTQ